MSTTKYYLWNIDWGLDSIESLLNVSELRLKDSYITLYARGSSVWT